MKTLKYIISAAVIASTMALASCSDVVDYEVPDKFQNNGTPVITAIYDVQDTQHTNALNGGVLNQMLRIVGHNLSNVKSVTFNGLEVDTRSIYAEADSAFLKIPRKIPEEVTNKLVYTTEQGTTELDFTVDIPNMRLEGLRNEFAKQGTSVQVSGEYFDLFGFNDFTETSPATITINNTATGYSETIHADSISEEYMSIEIPEDCPDNSLITFTWQEMGQPKTKSIPYRMTDQLMFGDFDGDVGWWNDWGKTLVTDGTKEGDPESLGYNYLRINGTFDIWSWNSTGLGCNWRWADAITNPQNYVLKFEVNTNSSKPFCNYGWNAKDQKATGGYYFSFEGADGHRYQWDPVTDGLTNTYGKWVTVSVPLNECLNSEKMPVFDEFYPLEIVVQPNSQDDSAWNIDHSFGQFRIEPKEY